MTATQKVRVLLADDEKHVRQLVKAILMPLNCEIVGEAENGAQAFDLYQQLKPDVVFLDVNMPVRDGKAALKDILGFNQNAVVIMLTSMSDANTVQAAVEQGAAYYIRKDTPPVEMRELIKDTWRQYHLID